VADDARAQAARILPSFVRSELLVPGDFAIVLSANSSMGLSDFARS
jgi:hypothetical protein